jgi:hypothetical protein
MFAIARYCCAPAGPVAPAGTRGVDCAATGCDPPSCAATAIAAHDAISVGLPIIPISPSVMPAKTRWGGMQPLLAACQSQAKSRVNSFGESQKSHFVCESVKFLGSPVLEHRRQAQLITMRTGNGPRRAAELRRLIIEAALPTDVAALTCCEPKCFG